MGTPWAGVGRPGEAAPALPDDPAIPALEAIARDGVEPTLRRAGLHPPYQALAVLRHHPGRRCVLALRAAGHPIVAKAYRRNAAAQALLLTELGRHGLASGRGPTAPPLVAYHAELRLLACARLDGPSGRDLIARGARVGELGADWLRRQWGLPLRLGGRYGALDFLERVERGAAVVAMASPRLEARVSPLLAQVERRRPPDGEPVLAHGSFSVNHVIDLGHGAGVIDWDGHCEGARELDAGAFLATLALAATYAAALEVPADDAARAFRAGIAGAVDPAVLAWYEAGALIRQARHLCVGRPPDWEARAERVLAGAGALLSARSRRPASAPRGGP
jgi:hypothetical protein